MRHALVQTLAGNPRSERLGRAISQRVKGLDEIDTRAMHLDILESNLGLLCAIFLQARPSSRVDSVLKNDCCAVALLALLAMLDQPSNKGDAPSLETIAKLLLQIRLRAGEAAEAVRGELVAAYLLAAATRNIHVGRPMFYGIPVEPALDDELHAVLVRSASLGQFTDEARRRLIDQ